MLRKKVINCDVEFISEEPVREHRIYNGFGQLRNGGTIFRFEVEKPAKWVRNPIIFRGKTMKARPTQDRCIRFTAVFKEEWNRKELVSFFRQMTEDIKSAEKMMTTELV